jgi:hypothetical protein
MPPIRNRNSKNLVEQEGRLDFALSAYKNRQIPSIKKTAVLFNVPYSTLRDRLRGRSTWGEKHENQHKLTPNEEESLVKWILNLDKRGRPPRHEYVRQMADHLLTSREPVASPPQVGPKWVYRFVKRHPELKSRFSRRYHYDRAKCEDPKIANEWFDTLSATLDEYGFLPEECGITTILLTNSTS